MNNEGTKKANAASCGIDSATNNSQTAEAEEIATSESATINHIRQYVYDMQALGLIPVDEGKRLNLSWRERAIAWALFLYFAACFLTMNKITDGDYAFAEITISISGFCCSAASFALSLLSRFLNTSKGVNFITRCRCECIKNLCLNIIKWPRKSLWYASALGCAFAMAISIVAFLLKVEPTAFSNLSVIWFILYFLVLHHFS